MVSRTPSVGVPLGYGSRHERITVARTFFSGDPNGEPVRSAPRGPTLDPREDSLHHDGSDPETLLARIALDHDRDAFALLFRGFAPRIAGFLSRGGTTGSVRDELVQEIMLRVWRRARQFDPSRASATTWIFAIARNARIDHLRRPAVQARVEPLDPAWVDDDATVADELVQLRQETAHLRAALDCLPPEQASVLQAAYYEHKSLRMIAEEQGVALGTIKSRVRLAFQRLRGTLESRT